MACSRASPSARPSAGSGEPSGAVSLLSPAPMAAADSGGSGEASLTGIHAPPSAVAADHSFDRLQGAAVPGWKPQRRGGINWARQERPDCGEQVCSAGQDARPRAPAHLSLAPLLSPQRTRTPVFAHTHTRRVEPLWPCELESRHGRRPGAATTCLVPSQTASLSAETRRQTCSTRPPCGRRAKSVPAVERWQCCRHLARIAPVGP